jgi:rare lipoprotein A
MSGRHKRIFPSVPRAGRPPTDRRKSRLLAVTSALTATTAIASACSVADGAPTAAERPAEPANPAASAPTAESLQAERQAQRAARGTGRQDLPAAPAAKPAAKPVAKPNAAAPKPHRVAKPRKQVTKKRETPRASRSSRAAVVGGKSCKASFYHEGQMTASGERFNPDALTAAHKSLPLGSKVRVSNPKNGASVVVRINDRGPYAGGRCLDLSRAAFDQIGSLDAGVMQVRYQVL